MSYYLPYEKDSSDTTCNSISPWFEVYLYSNDFQVPLRFLLHHLTKPISLHCLPFLLSQALDEKLQSGLYITIGILIFKSFYYFVPGFAWRVSPFSTLSLFPFSLFRKVFFNLQPPWCP
jgi:hypothetical protein